MKALQHLTDSVADWGIPKESFEVWAENVKMTMMPNWLDAGCSVSYVANVFISECTLPAERVLLQLSIWVNANLTDGFNSPELLIEPTHKGFADIGIKLQLSEDYTLVPSAVGEWEKGGVRYALASSFSPSTDVNELSYLTVFDSHTSDEIGTP